MLRAPLCGTAPAIAVLMAVAGCSTHTSVTNNAFDDLVNETRVSRTDLISYKSYVAVSGLVPHAGPGTIFHHPDGTSPTHGISLSPKWSYLVESTYPMGGTPEAAEKKVRGIREKYVEAREAIVKAVAASTAAALAEREVELARGDKERAGEVPTLMAAGGKARADATKATDAAAQRRDALTKAVDEKNILIARWDQRTEANLAGKVAEWLNLSAGHKQDIGGVLILGDLRVWSLKIGEDYIDMVREMNPAARQLFQRAGIDLFQVQARHREYVAELSLEDSVAASLSLTVEQLRKLKKLLADNGKIEAGLGAALLTDISNIGSLSSPEHTVRRRCFMPPSGNESQERWEADHAKYYQPVYQVRGQISNVEELVTITTDLSRKLAGEEDKKKHLAIVEAHTCGPL